jgi:hypothetical protein
MQLETCLTAAPSRSSRALALLLPILLARLAAADALVDPRRMAGVRSNQNNPNLIAREMDFARSCFADYEDMKTRWAPYEARLRAHFVEIQAMSSYYAQREAISELIKSYFATLKEAKLNIRGADWTMLVRSGLPYEVDAHLAALNRKRKISTSMMLFKEAEYPPIDDDVLAGDFYCHIAALEGSHRTAAYSGFSISEVLPSPRAKALQAWLNKAKAAPERDFAAAPLPKEHFTPTGVGTYVAHSMELPEGAALIKVEGSLENVRTDGRGVTLRIVQTGGTTRPHDCVETNKVDGFNADGTVRYRDTCKWSFGKSQLVYVATFPDAPKDLKKGDWIVFDGIINHVRKSGVDRATHMARTTTFEIAGTIIDQVSRAKRKGDDPREYAVLGNYY